MHVLLLWQAHRCDHAEASRRCTILARGHDIVLAFGTVCTVGRKWCCGFGTCAYLLPTLEGTATPVTG